MDETRAPRKRFFIYRKSSGLLNHLKLDIDEEAYGVVESFAGQFLDIIDAKAGGKNIAHDIFADALVIGGVGQKGLYRREFEAIDRSGFADNRRGSFHSHSASRCLIYFNNQILVNIKGGNFAPLRT
jgi:hypothetical protein